MKTSIRIAKLKDENQIIDCINSSYEKYIERIGKKPAPMLSNYKEKIINKHVHVMEKDNTILGLVILVPKTDHLYLGNLAVQPRMQGKGIGRQLMEFAERLSICSGLPEIRLFTNEKMYENLVIYPKLGYTEIERKTEDGYNRVYFKKTIKQ